MITMIIIIELIIHWNYIGVDRHHHDHDHHYEHHYHHHQKQHDPQHLKTVEI